MTGNGTERLPAGATIRLVLIRHGETEWNVDGRYQGQADPALSGVGVRQAADLARRLTRGGLDVLYSSPLRRATDTARAIGARLGLPVQEDARLMEINLGRWQGHLHTEIAKADPDLFDRWRSAPWEMTPPGGERLEQVRVRVEAAIDDIAAANAGHRIGVVTHRIPIVLLCIRFLGLAPGAIHTVKVPNGLWLVIDLRDGRAVGGTRRAGLVDAAEGPLV